jgi:hypothetical protein
VAGLSDSFLAIYLAKRGIYNEITQLLETDVNNLRRVIIEINEWESGY